MGDLVIDEWLWADLSGENSVEAPEAQDEAFAFIKAIYRKCDRIVTVRGSKFLVKAADMWRHTDIKRRTIARYMNDNFLHNTEKILLLDESSLESLPVDIANATNIDDHYLIQAYHKANASVLVTTDTKLKAPICNHVKCIIRNDFIRSYMENLPATES